METKNKVAATVTLGLSLGAVAAGLYAPPEAQAIGFCYIQDPRVWCTSCSNCLDGVLGDWCSGCNLDNGRCYIGPEMWNCLY